MTLPAGYHVFDGEGTWELVKVGPVLHTFIDPQGASHG